VYILVWRAGQHGERRATLAEGQTLTIGRGDTCDITLDDEAASRQHTRVCIQGDKVVIQDLASRNGTWLAGKRTTTARWKPGKPLRIGDTEIGLQAAKDPSSQPTVVVSKGKAAPASPATPPASNFVARHWRGGYSLGRSIFINTILVSVIFSIAVANLAEEVAADSSPRMRLVFITAAFLLGLAILVWQIVGDWRSLRGAKARGAGRISRWPAAVFTVLLALGVPSSFYEFTETWTALRDIETGRSAGGDAAYTLTRNGNVLTFNGVVTWPLVTDFQEQLEQNPGINVVVLNSPGGDTTAGRRINDILSARQIATAVLETCASSCTLIYAGGRHRAISPSGQLGFHASAFILMDPMMTRIMNALTFRSDALNGEYYRRAGFDAAFVERAITTPSTDLWVPPQDVLIQAGVVHEVVQP
jgi:ATP-dependent protease ClpP protease subunit